jgi:hypothetical protein
MFYLTKDNMNNEKGSFLRKCLILPVIFEVRIVPETLLSKYNRFLEDNKCETTQQIHRRYLINKVMKHG